MLWYWYILLDWCKSLFDKYKRHHTSVAWHPPHASYMNVITPHPTPPHPFPPTQVTWTLSHPTPPHHASYMNVITPHPTPPLPPHASYMNVITPHPFPPTQVTWTLSHPTPPHPFPPSGNPLPLGYIYMYIDSIYDYHDYLYRSV